MEYTLLKTYNYSNMNESQLRGFCTLLENVLFSAFDRLLNFSLFSRPCVSENTRQNQKAENAIET